MKKQLSKQERESIEQQLSAFNVSFDKKDRLELEENDKGKQLLINGESAFFFVEDKPVPLLRYLATHAMLKQIVVDMGAVKFVVSGADVMRPGIKEFAPSIANGELVMVVDINNKKPLCVGRMLFSGDEAQALPKGKVIKNLHWVGDEWWNS
jgi:PUA-domain protein